LPAIDFNLSHTDGLTACAVSAGVGVGVDVEKIRRLDDLGSLARKSFSAVEVAELFALPEAEHHRRFYELWSLKESYVKATGIGVALGLGKFSFRLSAGAPISLDIDPSLSDVAERWQMMLLRPTSDHMGALIVDADADAPLRLRTRTSVPLRSAQEFDPGLIASRHAAYPANLRARLDESSTGGIA
jgi:4'-phosphopantetheinyl transferase